MTLHPILSFDREAANRSFGLQFWRDRDEIVWNRCYDIVPNRLGQVYAFFYLRARRWIKVVLTIEISMLAYRLSIA